MNITENNIIGELVAEDYRTAPVFQSNGIDFCCQGNRTIKEACVKKDLLPHVLIANLQSAVNKQADGLVDYQSWPLDLLVDYIEKKHHRYVAEKIPVIKHYLDKVCKVHGEHHPELFKIKDEFFASADELTSHMKKEEGILFPFISAICNSKQHHQTIDKPHFGTVKNPIKMMMDEHEIEGNRFREIAALSNNYTPPLEACNTYKVAFAMLKEYEQDLHLHIHLENNIMFPKAIALENELSASANR